MFNYVEYIIKSLGDMSKSCSFGGLFKRIEDMFKRIENISKYSDMCIII